MLWVGLLLLPLRMQLEKAIVSRVDRSLLAENGDPVTLSKNWVKSLLYRLKKQQILLDIRAVVEMEEIPPQLVFKWDQIGISVVPGSACTMDLDPTC